MTIQAKNQEVQKKDNGHKFDGLTPRQFWAYGVGHFLNDLTAACWFNYLLFYLQTVVKTSAAPVALLAGQFCDGITTPIAGYFSDKYDTKYGKRTPWYIFGMLTILLCFIPIFHPFRSETPAYEYLYYAIFPGIFNIGWACLQISHMSLVPSLTCSRKRRDKLNNIRNSFTFIANLLVLLIGLTVFYLMSNKEKEYKLISYTVIAIGLASSAFFLYEIREKQLVTVCLDKKMKFKEMLTQKRQNIRKQMNIEQECIESDRHLGLGKSVTESTVDENSKNQDLPILEDKKEEINLGFWLRKPKFYLFGICYMCVRLNSNVFGTFIPFYLIYVLELQNIQSSSDTIPFSVALVPLITYFSSSILSAKISTFYMKIGRKNSLMVGTILSTISLGLLYILDSKNGHWIYVLAIFIGFSQSLILTTGINLISDVVGSKCESGAIVFGIYSFLDKISAGIIIYFIAQLSCFSGSAESVSESEQTMIKMTVIVIPMISALLASAVVLCGNVSQYLGQNDALSATKLEKEQFVHSVTLH